MYTRLLTAACFTVVLSTSVDAGRLPSIPFTDGSWHGEVQTDPNNNDFEECWASTTFEDGTAFTLARRKDGRWDLRLSNSDWHMRDSRQYEIVSLVDFYPRLHIVAEATSRTVLEIADIDRLALLGQIEIGHTIDLASDGFNANYDLEGSAKIIERIRNCFADHSSQQE